MQASAKAPHTHLQQGDVGPDALALHGVLVAHHRRLGALWVRHQRGLHLGGADAVAGHVDHIVHAACGAGKRGREGGPG